MIIDESTSLRDVAFAVCTSLHEIGVTAVLTGGSAATIWSDGVYQSRDCDFIITFYKADAPAEKAMKELGYVETGGTYRHHNNFFTLEFPPGPLAIGDELIGTWVTTSEDDRILNILSPADCCRDRLAGFYFWRDYSSLKAAIEVALHNEVDMSIVQSWSQREGFIEQFQQFEHALAMAKG